MKTLVQAAHFLVLVSGLGFAQPLFDAPLTASHTRRYAATGDIDGDGDMDLLGFEYDATINAYRAATYRNEPTLQFPRIASGLLPDPMMVMAFADINGDGIGDIVVPTF